MEKRELHILILLTYIYIYIYYSNLIRLLHFIWFYILYFIYIYTPRTQEYTFTLAAADDNKAWNDDM